MASERSKKDTSTKNKCYKELVNTTTPYEQSIAAKLEQVPIPDMADGIWANIDMQLDAVADGPDTGAPKKNITPKYTTAIWYGLAAAMVAATLLWYYSRKDHTPAKVPPQEISPIPQVTAPAKDSNTTVEQRKIPQVKPTPGKDSILLKDTLNNIPATDSIATPQPLPVRIDSSSVKHYRPYIDSANIPRRKKPKGVGGITPDDYRISTRKDSSGKEN
ncbi:hypothetical protein HBIMPC_19475 [Chitinophaga sp. 212800010-3]|nr:hypothetical protein [Chitinophaga sp. 212800010-3]